jgi:hypothetical protein
MLIFSEETSTGSGMSLTVRNTRAEGSTETAGWKTSSSSPLQDGGMSVAERFIVRAQ